MTIKLLGVAAGKGAAQPGAEQGPFVLRERGLVDRLRRAGHVVEDLGDIPGVHETRFTSAPAQNVNNMPHVLQVNRHTHACVRGTLARSPDSFLLILGGDHSLAIGTLAGLSDSCERLGLLWIDAHADFNTPRTTLSGNAHGMSLAVACGRGHRELRLIAGRDPMIDESDVFLLGYRDLDPDEAKALAESRITAMSPAEWRRAGVVRAVREACAELAKRCDRLHLSFDIDVLEPESVPGTGTPVADGMTVAEMRELLAELGARRVLASAGFVEYNPKLDVDGKTGDLTLDLIEALLPATQ